MVDFDVAIIGEGPAGMAAAIYAARKNLRTIVFEKALAGGYTAMSPRIENYPGFEGISGAELSERMEKQMRLYVKDVISDDVTGLELNGEGKRVITKAKTYTAKTVIIATGTKHRHLGVPGEKDFVGKGVFYCVVCDGPMMKGKSVAIVGGGNSALQSAIYLSSLCPKVYLIHRRSEFRGDEKDVNDVKGKQNVELVLDSEVKEIKGKVLVDTIIIKDKSGKERSIPVSGVFVQVGEDPSSQMAEAAGVAVDDRKRIMVNQLQETNVPGVYAAGDVCNTYAQTVIAAGHGASAALRAYDYITRGK